VPENGAILLVSDLLMQAANVTSLSQSQAKSVTSTRRRRGYPVDILGSSGVNEKFLCSLCFLVLRQAMQRYCGHRYCKDCVDDVAADTSCPACEKEGVEEQPPDDLQVDFRLQFHDCILTRRLSIL